MQKKAFFGFKFSFFVFLPRVCNSWSVPILYQPRGLSLSLSLRWGKRKLHKKHQRPSSSWKKERENDTHFHTHTHSHTRTRTHTHQSPVTLGGCVQGVSVSVWLLIRERISADIFLHGFSEVEKELLVLLLPKSICLIFCRSHSRPSYNT